MPRKPNPDNQAILLEAPPRGESYQIDEPPQPVHLHFKSKLGSLYLADSFLWLETLEPKSVDLIVADPPYSIKKADWDTFAGHDEYIEWSRRWIELASRALKQNGTMYVCGFSEILADIKVSAAKHFTGCRWLVWHYKNKANLGRDWRKRRESGRVLLYISSYKPLPAPSPANFSFLSVTKARPYDGLLLFHPGDPPHPV